MTRNQWRDAWRDVRCTVGIGHPVAEAAFIWRLTAGDRFAVLARLRRRVAGWPFEWRTDPAGNMTWAQAVDQRRFERAQWAYHTAVHRAGGHRVGCKCTERKVTP